MIGDPLSIMLVGEDAGEARFLEERLLDALPVRPEILVVSSLEGVPADGPDWDVVFLCLPGRDNIASVRAVQHLLSSVPVIVLRSDEDAEMVSRVAAEEERWHCLSKGELSPARLSQTIDSAIGQRRILTTPDRETELLFDVLDALHAFACLTLPDRTILHANQRFRDLFGSPGTGLGCEAAGSRDALCPDCPPMKARNAAELEMTEWTSSEGITYAIRSQVLPRSGNSALTLCVGLDVTERRRAEQELQQNEVRFRHLAERAPDILYRYRIVPRPGFDYISPAVTAVSGYTPEEYYADPLLGLQVVHPEDRHLLEGVAQGRAEAAQAHEVRWIHKDGHVVWTEDHHVPVHDEGGRIVAIEGIARDISESKRLRQVVAKSERRHCFLFERMGVGVSFYALDGSLIRCKRVAAVQMGGLPEEFEGKTAIELFGEEEGSKHLRRITESSQTQQIASYQDRTELATGLQWVLSTYSRVDSAGGGIAGVQVVSEEITGRKAAEAALAAEKERLFAVLDTLPAFVYLQAQDYGIPFANRRFIELFGDPKGRRCYELLLGRETACGECRTLLSLKTHETHVRDWETETGKTYELHEQPFSAQGEPEMVLVIGLDVTEQRRAAEAFRTADETIRVFPTGILIYECHGAAEIVLVSRNSAAAPLLQLEGRLGTPPRAHWPAEIAGHVEAALLSVADGGDVLDEELTLDTLPTKRTLHIQAFSIPGDRIVVSLEDVTMARETEAFLELARHSLDTSRACIFWILPDGRLIYVNDTACSELGIPREKLLEMAVWDIDPDYRREERSAFWAELQKTGSLFAERVLRRSDGSIFSVDMVAHVLEFRGYEYEFAFAIDATQRKAIEARLSQSQKLESIGTLASGVAHEINNPLTGIINYAQLISDRVNDAKLKRFADGIRAEGERVAKIVRNLLSFSRHEKEHHSPARIADIVSASLSLCSALFRKDQIQLELDVPEDLPKINCRSQEIQQVLINLLTNARDALNVRFPDPHAEKRILIRGRMVTEDGREWMRLTVEDHGTGMGKETVDRVFDPFFTTKSRDQGTGLGLSISYGLIREHEGRMTVRSVLGEGTRFDIDLPVDRSGL